MIDTLTDLLSDPYGHEVILDYCLEQYIPLPEIVGEQVLLIPWPLKLPGIYPLSYSGSQTSWGQGHIVVSRAGHRTWYKSGSGGLNRNIVNPWSNIRRRSSSGLDNLSHSRSSRAA